MGQGESIFSFGIRYICARNSLSCTCAVPGVLCALSKHTLHHLLSEHSPSKISVGAAAPYCVRCFACDFEEAKKVVKSCVDTLARCFVSKQTKIYNRNEREREMFRLTTFFTKEHQLYFSAERCKRVIFRGCQSKPSVPEFSHI